MNDRKDKDMCLFSRSSRLLSHMHTINQYISALKLIIIYYYRSSIVLKKEKSFSFELNLDN